MAPAGLSCRDHLTVDARHLHRHYAMDAIAAVAQRWSLNGPKDSRRKASATTPPLSLLGSPHPSLPKRGPLMKLLGVTPANA